MGCPFVVHDLLASILGMKRCYLDWRIVDCAQNIQMKKRRNVIALGIVVLLTATLGAEARSQDDRLWVLNEGRYDYTAGVLETPPSLGMISGETWSYEEVLSFPSSNFCTDLKIKGEMAYVALENLLVKIDLNAGMVMESVEVLGIQEIALVGEDWVVATRGGLDLETYLPLPLESHVGWWSQENLSLEGELSLMQGPNLACQAILVEDEKVFLGINNAWVWGEEVGRLGVWDLGSMTYEEFELDTSAVNPVALHSNNDMVLAVSNGDYTNTTLSKWSVSNPSSSASETLVGVSAGCNASAMVNGALALQIAQENGLRLMDPQSMMWTGEWLNPEAEPAYSLAVHPQWGWTCSGYTDYVSTGQVVIRTASGEVLADVPTGISPGTLVWQLGDSTSSIEALEASPSAASKMFDVLGRVTTGTSSDPGTPALRLEVLPSGRVVKKMTIGRE